MGLYVWGPCSLEHDYFWNDQTMGISLSSDHLCIICKVYGERWEVSFCPLLHSQLESCETPIVQVKPKVSFGPAVTPELIDKTLPPDTPVRKGSVPVGEMELQSWKFYFCHLMICYQLATLFLALRWQRVTAPRLSGPLSCHQVFTIDNCFQPFKWSSMQWSPKQMTLICLQTHNGKESFCEADAGKH